MYLHYNRILNQKDFERQILRLTLIIELFSYLFLLVGYGLHKARETHAISRLIAGYSGIIV